MAKMKVLRYMYIYMKRTKNQEKGIFHFDKLTDLLLFKTKCLKTELTYMRQMVNLQYHAQQ